MNSKFPNFIKGSQITTSHVKKGQNFAHNEQWVVFWDALHVVFLKWNFLSFVSKKQKKQT